MESVMIAASGRRVRSKSKVSRVSAIRLATAAASIGHLDLSIDLFCSSSGLETSLIQSRVREPVPLGRHLLLLVGTAM
jgi:hypothetical protein